MKQLLQAPVLLTIDMQKGFDNPYWGERNNPQAEENIQRLLAAWREKRWPIIHIQHLSLQPDSPLYQNKEGRALKDILQVQEGEAIIHKNVNSAFIGTDLEAYLRDHDLQTVVITGLSTQHCVSTTTRMSGNLGFHTFLVADATAAFGITDRHGTYYPPDVIHNVSLATLDQEFATVMTTDEILQAVQSEHV